MYLKARNRKLHALAARNGPFTNGRAMAKTLEKMPVRNFPCPKKGKMRMALKQKLTKKPASKLTQGKAWASTPYVRNGDKAPRVDRLKWKRTFQELAGLTEKDAIELLMREGLGPLADLGRSQLSILRTGYCGPIAGQRLGASTLSLPTAELPQIHHTAALASFVLSNPGTRRTDAWPPGGSAASTSCWRAIQ